MFVNRSLLLPNPPQLNYGAAVVDIDGDGSFEIFVTGFGFPNQVFKWKENRFVSVAPFSLTDGRRQSIGVAAADIDADGEEEIYVLNTDTFAGMKRFADRLFDHADGEWVDLFALPIHEDVLNLTAGRSVVGVDRNGTGQYGFFVANYGGPMRLYELDEDGRLQDVASQAQLDLSTGGRSALALPLVTTRMDIFMGNEHGANYLFSNLGDGTYAEIGEEAGVADDFQNARGVAAFDANGDGMFDLVIGNWEGEHRLLVQDVNGRFEDRTPLHMAKPSRVRTVIAADFDNDGYEEIFFNNIGEENRLFGFRSGDWWSLDLGDAEEPAGYGTGAVVGDFDGDGRLELIISHGEAAPQPVSYFQTIPNGNHWLRILPLTQYGAPARGALVTLITAQRTQIRVIDAGSGYLCQMEPVAHFGLGEETSVERVVIRWLDGSEHIIVAPEVDQMLRVEHPDMW
ncbi:CRTAC1 family protein [Geitlerinema splendidum]|nr:CRTAC1 family protein [Geitlerinema splendidum]